MIEIKITGDTANAIMNDLFVLAAAWAKEPEKATEALEKAQEVVKPIHLGDHLTKEQALETLKPLLTNDRIFGVDLVKAGLVDRVVTYFVSEIEGKGAVRRTIEAALKED